MFLFREQVPVVRMMNWQERSQFKGSDGCRVSNIVIMKILNLNQNVMELTSLSDHIPLFVLTCLQPILPRVVTIKFAFAFSFFTIRSLELKFIRT